MFIYRLYDGTIKNFTIAFKKAFRMPNGRPKAELLTLFVELSQTTRREGILALESKVSDITDPFLKNGLNMVIDGMDPEFVSDVLDAEVEGMEQRHNDGAAIFIKVVLMHRH